MRQRGSISVTIAITLAILAGFIPLSQSAPKPLRCPLQWLPLKSDASVPDGAIPSFSESIYVSRSGTDTGTYLFGAFEVTERKALNIASNYSSTVSSSQFDILANPFGCDVAWVDGYNNDDQLTRLAFSADPDTWVGMGEPAVAGLLTGGPIRISDKILYIPTAAAGVVHRNPREYKVLISYTRGFHLQVTDFIFEQDPSSSVLEMIGLDEINNEAGTHVSYSVTHSRETINRYSLTEFGSCSSSFGLAASVGLSFFGIIGGNVGVEGGLESEAEWEQTFTTETKQNLTLTRQVTVAPYTSVQVCSTLSRSSEEFETNYTAKAVFSSLGWSGEQVAEYLAQEMAWTDMDVHQDSASRLVHGTFKGAFSSSASTRVLPKGGVSCFDLVRETTQSTTEDYARKKVMLKKMRDAKPTTVKRFSPASDPTSITFTLKNRNGEYKLAVEDYDKLERAQFVQGEPVIFITHGFNSNGGAGGSLEGELSNLSGGSMNVVIVDWSELAAPGDWGIAYNLAVANTLLVGSTVSKIIDMLIEKQITTYDKIHLLGHSLGGQVMGFAGAFQFGRVGRITGLDPAGPLYVGACEAHRLDPTDAQFVHVIHTNGGRGLPQLGYGPPCGHFDVYPNGGTSQPQCDAWPIFPVDACSHERVWHLIVESVRTSQQAFKTCRCNSWEHFQNGCACDERAFMGFHASKEFSGSHYLRTNGESPYAIGE